MNRFLAKCAPISLFFSTVFFAKRFFYFEKNCTCYNITAVYYSHHPDMMVRIYKVIIEQKLSNHVRSSRRLYPLY